MYSQSKAVARFLLRLGPTRIVAAYILALIAVVAGAVASPFSSIWMGLLFVVVGTFFVVAIAAIVMVYLSFVVVVYCGLPAVGRRLVFGAGPCSHLLRTGKPSFVQKHLAPQRTDSDLWDFLVNGSHRCF
jgi:hypothetical protein